MKKYLTIDIGGSAVKYAVIDEMLNREQGTAACKYQNTANLIGTLYTHLDSRIGCAERR